MWSDARASFQNLAKYFKSCFFKFRKSTTYWLTVVEVYEVFLNTKGKETADLPVSLAKTIFFWRNKVRGGSLTERVRALDLQFEGPEFKFRPDH